MQSPRPLLWMPASPITSLGHPGYSASDLVLLLTHLGSKRWWLKFCGSCHPRGRWGWRPIFLALAIVPTVVNMKGMKHQMEDVQPLCYSAFLMKCIWKWEFFLTLDSLFCQYRFSFDDLIYSASSYLYKMMTISNSLSISGFWAMNYGATAGFANVNTQR